MDGAVISKREGEVMALFLSLSLIMLALGHAGLQKNKPLGPKREVEQSRMPDGLRKGKNGYYGSQSRVSDSILPGKNEGAGNGFFIICTKCTGES